MEDLNNLDQNFTWLELKNRSERELRFLHITRGFVKSFLLYLIPMTISRRRFTIRNIRRALALGFFVSGVRMTDSVLTTLTKEKEKANSPLTEMEMWISKYSLGVAGFLSSFFAILIDGEFQDSIVVLLWLIFRAIRSLSPTIPHVGTMLMCVATAELLPCLVFYPQYLNPGYYKFLLRAAGGAHGSLEKVLDQFKTIPGKTSSCDYLHPGVDCLPNYASIFSQTFTYAARLYIPVFAMSTFFSHKRSVLVFLTQVLRSTTFLSSYVATAWFACCMTDGLRGFAWTKGFLGEHFSFWQLASTVWLAGLTTFIETPSRRNDLAVYVFTYACESVYRFLMAKTALRPNATFNTFLISLAAGVLLHHHEQQPKVVVKSLFKLSHVRPL